MQSSIFQEFQLKYQVQQVSFKAPKHPSKELFNLWENIKQADFIVRFRWRKAMSCKNAALCSAEHAESISGLSIERGRRGGRGVAWEQLSQASLFLRPPQPTHARSHRSNSNCQRHILTSAVGGRISWQTSTRPVSVHIWHERVAIPAATAPPR